MATGGNFSRTLEGGHEPFYDFSCSLCEEEGKHVEAVKYCEECLVYLCDHCLRDKHNKFPLNKRHQLLDQSQFATVIKSAIVSFPTKRCPKHPGELINIFCGNHDVVCCSVCKALEHSYCVKTQHLPDASKGIQTNKQYQGIKTGTRALISDLDKVLNDQKVDVSRIAKEKQHVTQTIADFRKKVNKYFHDLEKNCLDELGHREKTFKQGIDKDRKFFETTKSKAEDILKQLESFKGENECELFVQVKRGWNFLDNSQEKLRDMCKLADKPFIHFEINRSIEEYIASLTTLGSFSSTHVGATHQPLSSAVPGVTSSGPSSLASTQKQSGQEVQQFTYKAQYCEKFRVENSDRETCDIPSICQLPDGTFLITDWSNRKLKRLNLSLKHLDSVQLPESPHSVTAAGPGQAVVSLCLDKKIQLVSVGKKLTLIGSFTVGSYCRGIVFIAKELFVCCGVVKNVSSYCIEVYNNTGQLQRTISRAPQMLSLLPCFITACDNGKHLLITSGKNDNITMLDLIGNVVNTFTHKDLKVPKGICTDSKGQVFVCGKSSNTVVQLSPKHQKIEIILNEADGIKTPQGVYYDKDHSRLLVSCDNSNEILTFTLK